MGYNVFAHYKAGVSFSQIGSTFGGRLHRFRSVIDASGSSVYAEDNNFVTCLMNSTLTRRIMESLNPTVNFQVGDVNRIPLIPQHDAKEIVWCLHETFSIHECHREPSAEFKSPGPSPWRHAQDWAQAAVDRPKGEPLPPYVEELDPEPPTDHVSFALGVALGRFGANGEGILDPAKDDLSATFPAGICFLDGSLDKNAAGDSLGHSAADLLHAKWAEKGPPPPDAKTPAREADARYAPDLDDGVMINSAALWPLLEAQWKDPKKWWRELAAAKGKKDYDWAHLAARYFPSRVDRKCQTDPSLAVAHGCFWKYHPENAYKWELRLQDEIGPDFTLDEPGSDGYRADFEEHFTQKVDELVIDERKRREKKRQKETQETGGVDDLIEAAGGSQA